MTNRLKKFLALTAAQRRTVIAAMLLLPFTAMVLQLFGFRRARIILIWICDLRSARRVATPSLTLRESPPPSNVPVAVCNPDRLQSMGGETDFYGQAQETARLVSIAAYRGSYSGNCLKRSMTLWFLLRRQGIEGELRIGTRKADGKFEAHAWVEYRGKVLNDTVDVGERFAAFKRNFG
ncbi:MULTISPECIES: lasso peptide biosynthesis B2 protein [unclassified Mesorhizobium]|uniref:lasso peptide biosynthesis B2 protein n=1 Tax=unclassified Mesorhizobium TaxID=325217 RepID=UPI0019D03401|nr:MULTISPECIES: lasso peptide biosynthesis B2 protein [unclassified Mesorhizobium]